MVGATPEQALKGAVVGGAAAYGLAKGKTPRLPRNAMVAPSAVAAPSTVGDKAF